MRISISDRLHMDQPEGFRELTEKELTAMNLPLDKSIGISDTVRNLIITVEWKQVNELASLLMGTREASWNMSRQLEKKLKKFSYYWIDDVKRTIDGQPARGEDYEYVSNGINMSCESLVVKVAEDLFYFHMYGKKARRAENLETFGEILDSVVIPM